MTWTHVRQNYGMGLVEQWIFRAQDAPCCSLKKGETTGTWQASFLNRSGVSCTVMELPVMVLGYAQEYCESRLREMGWHT